MIRHASLALLLTAPIAAQSLTVFPSDHTGTAPAKTLPGSTGTSDFPFSWGISHQQVVFESFDLKIPNGAQINRIGFPIDGTRASTGYRVQLEVRMGYSLFNSKTITSNYLNNYSSVPVTVFTKKIFTCPDLGGVAGATEVWIPLDTPMTHDSSKNLIVEFLIHANSNSNQPWTYRLDGASFLAPVVSFGNGCPTSGGRIPSLKSGSSTIIGGTWNISLRQAAGSSAAFLNIGTPIQPGIGLAGIGAPGCELLVSPWFSASGTTNASGSKSWSLPIPFDRSLLRAHLYSQAISLDLFANNLGAVLSNGDDVSIGVYPLSTVVANQGDNSKTAGSIYRNHSSIVMFEHQ